MVEKEDVGDLLGAYGSDDDGDEPEEDLQTVLERVRAIQGGQWEEEPAAAEEEPVDWGESDDSGESDT